jgi:hypothetical protein
VAVVIMVFALTLVGLYGIDSHHDSPDSIWPARGRRLIPPTATDITLQRDLLDHRATYTVSEEDLNAFLDWRFAGYNEVHSYAERDPVDLECSRGTTLHWERRSRRPQHSAQNSSSAALS